MPTPPTPPRDDRRPEPDRAAGALLGPLAAAALVGAPPTKATTDDPLTHLIHTALGGAHEPAPTDPPQDPTTRAWAHTLRTLVHTGHAPAHSGVLEHTSDKDPHGLSWRALTRTPLPPHDPARGSFPCTHLVDAIWAAYRIGGDNAALHTGALAGARWGASALPLQAMRRLSEHTDPHPLITTALQATTGHNDPTLWPQAPLNQEDRQRFTPFAVPHPLDPQVLLGNMAHLRHNPTATDAVVSLCRTHPHDAPHLPGPDWVRVWLHDTPGANSNLHFTLDEAAAAVATLRAEGKSVLLHCWAGASRTPAVAARYAITALGTPPLPTLTTLITTVGGHLDNPTLSQAVAELSGLHLPDPVHTLFHGHLPPRRPDLRPDTTHP